MTSPVDTAVWSIHLIFAAIWVGGVIFMATVFLPAARDGKLNSEPLNTVSTRFSRLSLLSAFLLFVSGGHMAGTKYEVETLTQTNRGYLVLAMIGMWLLLAAVLHLGSRKIDEGVDKGKVRDPAKKSLLWYRIGSVIGVLLLLDAAALTTNLV